VGVDKKKTESLPGSDEVGPVMQHHSADDFLPATVRVANRIKRTDGSVDQRRAEQVLERSVLVVDRVDGVGQRHRPARPEAVEISGGGMRRGGVVARQLDRGRSQLTVDDQLSQAVTVEPVVHAQHFTRRRCYNAIVNAVVTTSIQRPFDGRSTAYQKSLRSQ